MKKALFILVILGLVFTTNLTKAQEKPVEQGNTETQMDSSDNETQVAAEEADETIEEASETVLEVAEKPKFSQEIKKQFIDGGGFMFPVLLCLIIGLAIAIEKIITLNLKSINTKKFMENIEGHLKNNDPDGAQELCRNTRGSVASIFYQAFLRRKGGIENVEKSIVSYGSVQMGLLEKGLIWISLFIAIAPMLGFMGTVIGMIEAFDRIEAASDISPSIVAGGIKVALLTTVAGLIVAVILQLFYNYLVAKVDSIVNSMEDASISLVDLMVEYDVAKK